MTTSTVGRSTWPSRNDISSARASRAAWSAASASEPASSLACGGVAVHHPAQRLGAEGDAVDRLAHRVVHVPGQPGSLVGGADRGHRLGRLLPGLDHRLHVALNHRADHADAQHQRGQPGDQRQPALPAGRGRGQHRGRRAQAADHQRNHQQRPAPAGETAARRPGPCRPRSGPPADPALTVISSAMLTAVSSEASSGCRISVRDQPVAAAEDQAGDGQQQQRDGGHRRRGGDRQRGRGGQRQADQASGEHPADQPDVARGRPAAPRWSGSDPRPPVAGDPTRPVTDGSAHPRERAHRRSTLTRTTPAGRRGRG